MKPRGAPEASTGDRHGLEKTGQGPRCELLGRLAALPGALQEPKVALELIWRYSLTHTRVCGRSCSEAQALNTGSASVLVNTTHLKPKHFRVPSCTQPQGLQEGDWASTGSSQLNPKISKKGLLVLLRSAPPVTKKDGVSRERWGAGCPLRVRLASGECRGQDHPDSAQRGTGVGHWHLDPGRCAHIPATGWRRRLMEAPGTSM